MYAVGEIAHGSANARQSAYLQSERHEEARLHHPQCCHNTKQKVYPKHPSELDLLSQAAVLWE